MMLAVLALTVALAATACGDGGEPGEEPSPSPTAGQASPQPTPTVDVTLPAACQALQSLKSYRYTSRMTLESPEPTGTPDPGEPTPTATITRDFTGPFEFKSNTDASVVAPDRIEATLSGSTAPVDVIAIGRQTWERTRGSWTQAAQPVPIPYGPIEVCRAILPELDLAQVESQSETINDHKALRYTFSQVSSEMATAMIFGQDSDMDFLLRILDVDLWLSEGEGWPARIELRSSGRYADGRELRMHLVVDVMDANDDSIQVEPPL